jgi:Protein of unknown function (DUF2911)
MKKYSFIVAFLSICILGFFASAQAQIKMPQPSPLSKLTQNVGLAEITIAYSRPSLKGRSIFGNVVPFDKMWRTGANRPTKIKFDDEVSFEGNKVAAGEYSLYSIPGKTEWTFILSKDTKGDGVFSYQESDDVIRFKAKAQTLPQSVETFTINFADITNTSANVQLMWEKTFVQFKIENEITSKIEAQIKKQLDPAKEAGLYSQIAGYYLEANKNLDEALTLITKSTDLAPRYWTLHTKAKIQAKLNKNADAIATAEKSKEMAKKDSDDNYVRMNDELIAQLKKAK